jgi:antitoxin component of MazEF toxin-antitoxin module
MVKKLHAIGNSYGVIIDRALLDSLGIKRDTLLDISTDGKALTIRPLDETSHKARVKRAAARVSQIHQETFRKLAK